LGNELVGKQIGMLHELLPQASHFCVLSDPNAGPAHELTIKNAQDAASAIGGSIDILTASTGRQIDAAFVRIANEKRVQGLLVGDRSFFLARRVQLAILAARFAVPAIYSFREAAEAGGLLSYGSNLADEGRQVGSYVGRILKGEKTADLPVMQATQFELVVNLNTARALGLTVPPTLLALANEVIE
jgi:putative ABC transport system substrate-binding protein